MTKKRIGEVMVTISLLGISASLFLIASITQTVWLWLIGCAVLLTFGVYLLKKCYFLR